MSTEVEKALHVHRIRQQLQSASTLVWEKPEFPAAHRPDVASLSPKIKIGAKGTPLVLHPEMRPDILARLRAQMRAVTSHNEITQIAWHDAVSGEIFFSPKTIGLHDRILKPTIYHEAAHSLIPAVSIPPDQYSEIDRRQVSGILHDVFEPSSNIALDQSSITKIGFRKYIEVDGFFITDLIAADVMYLDEIYATTMELITSQIAERGGNIARFDADAKNGRLRVDRKQEHQLFSKRLFSALQFIDWRCLLDAFKTGDLDEAIAILSQHVTAPAEGSGIFVALFETMKADEDAIATAATTLHRRNTH